MMIGVCDLIKNNLKYYVQIKRRDAHSHTCQYEEYIWLLETLGKYRYEEKIYDESSSLSKYTGIWDYVANDIHIIFYFLYEKDAMLFKLTWGGV